MRGAAPGMLRPDCTQVPSSRAPMLTTCALTMLASAVAQDCPQWDAHFAAAGADAVIRDSAVLDIGSGHELYVSGDFTRIGGVAAAGVARWNGSAWTAIASQITGQPTYGQGRVWDVEAFDDGSGLALYAAGQFSSIDGVA